MRGIRKKIFEPKIFGKINFIAFLGHFFQNFGARKWSCQPPLRNFGQATPNPLRLPTESVRGSESGK